VKRVRSKFGGASLRPRTGSGRSWLGRLAPLAIAGGLFAASAAAAPSAAADTPQTPQQAVDQGIAAAAADGFDQHVSVRDRNTGALLAQSADADDPVASESLVKLFTAANIIVNDGGYQNTSSSTLDTLSYMIRYSDDATETSLFSFDDVPNMVARYGLSSNTNNGPNPWGAVSITANDETEFLYKVLKDPEVGPWLVPVMAAVNPTGSDGFDQDFGFNALTGTHGSKQGWGSDNWGSEPNAIHSIGYTDKYVGAILSTGASGSYHEMEDPDTNTAQLIQAAVVVDHDPTGSLSSVHVAGNDVEISGSVEDVDASNAAIDVRYVADKSVSGTVVASEETHGFSSTLVLSAGVHDICAYGINLGQGTNTLLGCRTLTVPVYVPRDRVDARAF